ncbi:coiled-coil domain-containing protein 30 isoform X2 [Lepisosteus oculatus]|uniref:coiled-coil domain-containing protein 30 isoform X2 n=1 Tax=Lepisosteus oculatus TaxID=7918 RepID=UPI0037143046
MEEPEERAELGDIAQRLREDGLTPGATADERLRHLWRLFLRSEGSLLSVTQDLQALRTQQAAEMKEVENYVDHIRNLSEERETLTAEYERENEQLRLDLQQLRVQQEAQLKEVEEMLEQEGLEEITHSSPSEQIAYLLVERATLLEKLEAAERKLDTQSLTGSLREVHLQEELDQIRQTLEEELRQQRESMQRTKETMNKDSQSSGQSPWKKLFGVRKAAQSTQPGASAHGAELSDERLARQRLERDLDEASRRLAMAHEEIRRLSNELDSARQAGGQCEPELQRANEEVELLKEEVAKLKERDVTELQKAKEQNDRLDREILALRARVRHLDAERRSLLDTVESLRREPQSVRDGGGKAEESLSPAALLGQVKAEELSAGPGPEIQTADASLSNKDQEELIHKRCRQDAEDQACRLRELQRRLLKLQAEHEELVERNEELEALLGEAQNRSKEERERHEGEAEGMRRKATRAGQGTPWKGRQSTAGQADAQSHQGQYSLKPVNLPACLCCGRKLEHPEESQAMTGRTYFTNSTLTTRQIKRLEGELSQLSQDLEGPQLKREIQPLALTSEPEAYLQQLKSSSQEKLAVLEGRLTEEQEWRKQLEVDLTAAQGTLKKEREELHRSQGELRSLRMETQALRAGLQESRSLSTSLTQLQGEKDLLEHKVSELERAQARLESDLELQRTASRGAQEELRQSRARASELRAQVGGLKAEVGSLERDRNALRDALAEGRAQLAELQKQLNESAQDRLRRQEEKQRLSLELQCVREQLHSAREEGRRLRQEAGRDLGSAPPDRPRDEGASQMSCVQLVSLKVEMGRLQTTLEEERLLASQHQLALQAQISEAQARAKSQDALLQQKGEECRQIRQDAQRTQSLFTSAERELRYEREKNLDLKKHNALLDQEKLRVCAELKQAQARLTQLEQSSASLGGELERVQQRARELELEMARGCQSRQAQHSLEEELCSERARLLAADKKVLELQQQLKSALHQLRLEETRASEADRLHRESKDMAQTLGALRAKLQEEQLQRKRLEQREEELQQQARSLREREASLTRATSELGLRLQQQEARLGVQQAEHSAAEEEHRHTQKANQNLAEQLLSCQQESERLQEELQQVLQQLDLQVRKYDEKQAQHKAKLRKAKQVFVKETSERDGRIQQLENDLALAHSLAEKEQDWIKKVTEENEKLLLEKRHLLKKLSEEEEVGHMNMRTTSTIQHRVNFLEGENRQLQDRTLQLSTQVGALERALRNVQSVCSMEELKKMFPAESLLLNGSVLQPTNPSLAPGMCSPLGILDVIRRVKTGEHPEIGNASLSQPSEIGYLNVTSTAGPTAAREHEDTPSLGSDEV